MGVEKAVNNSARARDAGLARLRRLTSRAAALALAGTGLLSAFAASSFHGRRVATLATATTNAAASQPVSQLATPSPTVPFEARSPGAEGAASGSAAATPPPAPAPPQAARAPTPAPPVVVSGGS